jgi:hypothetical protein
MEIPTNAIEILPNLWVTKEGRFYTVRVYSTKPSEVVEPKQSTQNVSESHRGKITGKLPQGAKYVYHDGKQHFVHRLLAKAFIPNPENKPQINHKDGNRHNNDLSNLEWNTASENIRHARENNLTNNEWAFKPICQYDSEGKLIATYKSIKEAAKVISGYEDETKIHSVASAISHHARNYKDFKGSSYPNTYGYQWRFQDDSNAITKHKPILDLKKAKYKVLQLNQFNNRLVKEHDSLYIAASYFTDNLKSGRSAIYNAIRKDGIAYGFRWAYA